MLIMATRRTTGSGHGSTCGAGSGLCPMHVLLLPGVDARRSPALTAVTAARGVDGSPDRAWQHRGVVVSRVTRGTTGVNRLRRVDRWVAATGTAALRGAARPLVVDLGFGANPTTTLELAARLAAVVPRVRVVGVEIDPARVAAARQVLAAREALAGPGGRVRFMTGGFDLAGVAEAAGARPLVLRAANVLRQYDEHEVGDAWSTMAGACAPGAVVVDMTCDELGRRAAWVALRVGERLG